MSIKLRDLILGCVPKDGSTIGNQALIAELRNHLPDLNDTEYHATKDTLVAEGLLAKGRGRGGSVSRADGKAAAPAASASAKSKPAAMPAGNGSAAYAHADEAVLRPDVGVEAQFSHRKPPKTYRYDSSLAPELAWDENGERPFAEWLLKLVAIKKGSATGGGELAIIPHGAAGRGSTLYVDFHTTKPIYPVTRCHLNAMVADTNKWEQSAAFLLDSHPGVKRWVKNDRLGFTIPYRHRGLLHRYIPDFIVVTDRAENVVIEVKGRVTDDADVKAKAAERWVEAVNRLGEHGVWRYLLVEDPGRVGEQLNAFTSSSFEVGPLRLT